MPDDGLVSQTIDFLGRWYLLCLLVSDDGASNPSYVS